MSVDRPEPTDQKSWFNSLSVRVGIFLSFALLPLGLLAVLQTRDLAREVQSRSELSLLALTENAAAGERQMLERGFGAAEALGAVLRIVRQNPEDCIAYLRDYLKSSKDYSYVGFVPPDGIVRCASNRQFVDFSESQLFASLTETPRQVAVPISDTWDPSGSDVIVYDPVMDSGDLLGFTVISIKSAPPPDQTDQSIPKKLLGLVTVNAEGQILTALAPETTAFDGELPQNRNLALLAGAGPGTFFGQNENGESRLYIHKDIVPGIAYALGIWEVDKSLAAPLGLTVPASVFPLLMWIASLAVGILAVHRLVVRHLQKLGVEMRRFAQNRRIPDKLPNRSLPYEIQQLEDAFQAMVFDLVKDEARMEDALREKNVLLKEVHHRVKNNLQMISSIMNMKIRKSNSDETRASIRRLQERVLGLATVHRNLYQTEDLSKTNAGALLREIFSQLVTAQKAHGGARIQVTMDLDDIIMFPDQAVPCSLMANEIATNALKNAGSAKGEEPWVSFAFKADTPGTVRLECRNSTGEVPHWANGSADDGLGSQLIKAFSMQLSADYQIDETPGEYRATATFAVQDFKPDAQDY